MSCALCLSTWISDPHKKNRNVEAHQFDQSNIFIMFGFTIGPVVCYKKKKYEK